MKGIRPIIRRRTLPFLWYRQMSAVNIEAMSEHIEKILAQKLQEKNLTLRKEFEIQTIYGEEALFVNLFRNLLENAVRASRPGDEIVFRAYIQEQKQIFEIIDDGIGMEEEELKRITEAFYRVDKARSRKDGGVGLVQPGQQTMSRNTIRRMCGKEDNDENHKFYIFEIECISGNIISFGKFHPYQKNKDYSAISWTDEEIKARAKELIETYDLTKGEELDWSNLYLYNGSDQLEI